MTSAHQVQGTSWAITGTGISWSASEHGTGAPKMSAPAFGCACAFGAIRLMTVLFRLALGDRNGNRPSATGWTSPKFKTPMARALRNFLSPCAAARYNGHFIGAETAQRR